MAYCYDYPRPALAVDCVVFGLAEGGLDLLLIERGGPPFEGQWALPGGFVEMDETAEEAARRELCEETGLTLAHLDQLQAFSAVDRDPRQRVVSVAFLALVKKQQYSQQAGSDASAVKWAPVEEAADLAFDHDEILAVALERVRRMALVQPIGLDLLPVPFPLSQLRRLYEAILGRPLDTRKFSRKIRSTGLLVETPAGRPQGARRGARLYRFDRRKYRELTKAGLYLDL